MKIRGGYLPKISGRPSSIVEELPLPGKLQLDLCRYGLVYGPIVKNGQEVACGDPLAEAVVEGGTLALPAPASGRIFLEEKQSKFFRLTLETSGSSTTAGKFERFELKHTTTEMVRNALTRAGIWPFFWSSLKGGMPVLAETKRPRAIIVNCVCAEPFKTRGKVILRRSWDRIVQAMKFLPRLLADYGTIEVVLTAKHDPVAGMMYTELAGHAWVNFHEVPLLYPVEYPRVLSRAFQRTDSALKKDDIIWVIDLQGLEAVGACLTESVALCERVLSLGGPGHLNPRHVSVRIGTPLRDFLRADHSSDDVLILRGGLLTGTPVDIETDSVTYDDDAFFFLPKRSEREFLSFVRPGFDRTSALPCFMSQVFGGVDRHITTSLRGERRPCIACGLCEKICPAGLMPQVLHRYLYSESLDEAAAAGLDLCVDCALCTYVCPSKIEVQREIHEAREQLRREKAEALAAEDAAETGADSADGPVCGAKE